MAKAKSTDYSLLDEYSIPLAEQRLRDEQARAVQRLEESINRAEQHAKMREPIESFEQLSSAVADLATAWGLQRRSRKS